MQGFSQHFGNMTKPPELGIFTKVNVLEKLGK
jgi:hypothetical protein